MAYMLYKTNGFTPGKLAMKVRAVKKDSSTFLLGRNTVIRSSSKANSKSKQRACVTISDRARRMPTKC